MIKIQNFDLDQNLPIINVIKEIIINQMITKEKN